MKNYINILIGILFNLLILHFFIPPSILSAQEYEHPIEFSLTSDHIVGKHKEDSNLNINFYIHGNTFRPIGWSKDGVHFAWISIYLSEASPPEGFDYRLNIMNAITDEVVYTWSIKDSNFNNWDQFDDLYRQGKDWRILLWDHGYKEIRNQLRKYDIQQMNMHNLFVSFPVSINGIEYSPSIEKYAENEESGKKNYRVSISAKSLGSKNIKKIRYSRGRLKSWIAGAFLSPFSRRAIVLHIYKNRGFEGPPHALSSELIGVHLTKGFKK